jgi:hypothetical protein
MWPAALTRYVTGYSKLLRQLGLEPQEPHPPPQQPPALSPLPASKADDGSPVPANAKLETSTRVLVDSHEGQTCAWSLSANRVNRSNFPEQLSHRYSYMGMS